MIIVFSFLFSPAYHFLGFCNNDAMSAVFERTDLPKHVNINNLYLRDRQCKASYNSTHVFINTALTGVSLYEETQQTMYFSNTLSERSQYASGAGVITRNYLFNANFTCIVGTFSFEPAQQRLTVYLSKYVLHVWRQKNSALHQCPKLNMIYDFLIHVLIILDLLFSPITISDTIYSEYKKVGVLQIRMIKCNVSSVGALYMSERNRK